MAHLVFLARGCHDGVCLGITLGLAALTSLFLRSQAARSDLENPALPLPDPHQPLLYNRGKVGWEMDGGKRPLQTGE